MSSDRFRELWPQTESPVLELPLVSAPTSAFVLCPMPVLQFMAPWQHAQAICLYRLAYEQAQNQAQRSQSLRIPAFSAN
jgi:hypothetical protein